MSASLPAASTPASPLRWAAASLPAVYARIASARLISCSGRQPPSGSRVCGSRRVAALYSTPMEFTSTTGESVPNASVSPSSSMVLNGHISLTRSSPKSRSGPPGSSVICGGCTAAITSSSAKRSTSPGRKFSKCSRQLWRPSGSGPNCARASSKMFNAS